MPGPCGTLTWKMGDVRSRAQVHSFARIFDQGMTASQPSLLLDETALAKVAEIAARRTLNQIDGELEQANFPCVVYTLYDRAKWFVLIFDLSPRAIDHGVDRIAERLFV